MTLSGGDDPAGTALRAGVDLALAAGAFGQSVTLVFCGKGLALLSNKPQTNGDLFRLLGSLPITIENEDRSRSKKVSIGKFHPPNRPA